MQPLAKLDTADAFERMFGLYWHQAPVLLGTALVIFVPIALLSGVVGSSGSVLLGFVLVAFSLVGQSLYTGSVVGAVADMRDGRRDYSVGDLLRASWPFVLPLVAAGVVYGLCVAGGLILLIVPGLIFLTWFSLFAPAIVVERRGVFDSFNRSRELVRGNGWRVFGVIVVAFLIQALVQNLLSRIAVGASDSWAVYALLSGIGGVITAPIFGLAASVVYFQLRDLEQGTQGLAAPAPPPQPQPRF